MYQRPMVKVIIAGGRDYENYNELECVADHMLEKLMNTHDIAIISGGARGADAMAMRYANHRGFELIVMPADWDTHGKSAGYKRNTQMAEAATHLIAFWDGKSRGTANMIQVATKLGLKLCVIRY